MIRVKCPMCGERIEFVDGFAGFVKLCPLCKARIFVPPKRKIEKKPLMTTCGALLGIAAVCLLTYWAVATFVGQYFPDGPEPAAGPALTELEEEGSDTVRPVPPQPAKQPLSTAWAGQRAAEERFRRVNIVDALDKDSDRTSIRQRPRPEPRRHIDTAPQGWSDSPPELLTEPEATPRQVSPPSAPHARGPSQTREAVHAIGQLLEAIPAQRRSDKIDEAAMEAKVAQLFGERDLIQRELAAVGKLGTPIARERISGLEARFRAITGDIRRVRAQHKVSAMTQRVAAIRQLGDVLRPLLDAEVITEIDYRKNRAAIAGNWWNGASQTVRTNLVKAVGEFFLYGNGPAHFPAKFYDFPEGRWIAVYSTSNGVVFLEVPSEDEKAENEAEQLAGEPDKSVSGD